MRKLTCDVAVIGAGGAGLRAAVEARSLGADVLVISKGTPGQAGTTRAAASDWMAYGAAFGHADQRDSPHEHWVDIMVKGGLVCRPELSRRIAFEAPDRLLELEAWGADFDKTKEGKFRQILSDGARFPRACGRGADTGPVIMDVLMARAQELGVRFLGETMIVDALLDGKGAVAGCWGLCGPDDQLVTVEAAAVVLAAGGAGKLYELNVYPEGMTGDAYALALRAGAPLVNMEFIQIGPSIVHPIHFALSGVFWRLDPRLTNANGEEFVEAYFPEGSDIAAAIHEKGYTYPFSVRNPSKWVDVAAYTEIAEDRGTEHRGVLLDISHNDPAAIEERAAVPLEHLLRQGMDIRREPVEFAPAVQHFNGGVAIDESAATELPGLFAAGESAGGQHGADRPGGNALADCQVFGRLAGQSAAELARERGPATLSQAALGRAQADYEALCAAAGGDSTAAIRTRLTREMWMGCCVVRTEESVSQATAAAQSALAAANAAEGSPRERAELRNLALVGRCVAQSALLRTESRGTHYRADRAEVNDPGWQNMLRCRLVEGEVQVARTPPIEMPPELAGIEDLLEG